MSRNVFIVVMVLILSGAVFSQGAQDESDILQILERSKLYYNNGEYEKAITELEKALNLLYKLKQNDRVEAYKYLGFSYVAFGDIVKAKESFKKALSLNPDLTLDPTTVSPKIIQVFEAAKAEIPALDTSAIRVGTKPEPEYKRPDYGGALIRSTVFPGWGQFYKGDRQKGMLVLVGTGSCLGATIFSALMESAAHEKYLEDEDKYKAYNFWFNMTRIGLVSTGAFWLYGIFDAAFIKSKTQTSLGSVNNKSGFVFAPAGDKIRLGYIKRF